jgi:hypothetical protein
MTASAGFDTKFFSFHDQELSTYTSYLSIKYDIDSEIGLDFWITKYSFQYPLLTPMAQSLVILVSAPTSQAYSERAFSLVVTCQNESAIGYQ